MDMVWVDTMFPGINEEDGWEKNLERVVNYDYLLKEYLDWQLKHLTTDNMDPTDWSNVTSDLIHIAAEYTNNSVEAAAALTLETADDHTAAALTSYYTKAESDAQAQLTLETADSHTAASLQSYYTKSEIGDFTGYQSAVAALQAYADSAVANIDLSAYYTSSEVDSAISTSEAGLKLYTDNAVASIDLSAYATTSAMSSAISTSEASVKGYADGLIAGLSLQAVSPQGGTAHLALMSGQTELGSGASLGLSVTNNSNGYSYVKLTSGGFDLATSGNITLGGNVVFASGSGTTKNLSYTTINGGTVTTNTITALNITANNIVANASISSPAISGGTISGNTISSSTISGGLIVGSTFYSTDKDSYFLVGANGWSLYQKSGSSWYERAALQASSTSMKIVLGSDNPKAVFEKYYVTSTEQHYLWLGDLNKNHGLLINLSTGAYSFS